MDVRGEHRNTNLRLWALLVDRQKMEMLGLVWKDKKEAIRLLFLQRPDPTFYGNCL